MTRMLNALRCQDVTTIRQCEVETKIEVWPDPVKLFGCLRGEVGFQ